MHNLREAGISATGLLLICHALSLGALLTPWWQGGKGGSAWVPWQVKADLWRTAASVDKLQPRVRSMVIETPELAKLERALDAGTRWDVLCDYPSAPGEFQSTCAFIKVARAMVILAALVSLPAVPVLLVGTVLESSQILFVGGTLACIAAVCTLLAVICGLLISVDGLGGAGYLCIGTACCAAIAGTVLSTVFLRQELRHNERVAAGIIEGKVLTGHEAADAEQGKAGSRTLRNRAETERQAREPPPEYVIKEITDMADIWNTMDEAGNGEVPLELFCETLKNVCGLPTDVAVRSILKEVDKDMSGTVEYAEFLAFFKEVEDLSIFFKKQETRGRICQYILAIYLVMGVCALIVFACWEAGLSPGTDAAPLVRMGRLLSTICVSHGILFAVLFPLFGIKCRRYIDHYSSGSATEHMVHSLASYISRNDKTFNIPVPPEDHLRDAARQPSAPPPRGDQIHLSYVETAKRRNLALAAQERSLELQERTGATSFQQQASVFGSEATDLSLGDAPNCPRPESALTKSSSWQSSQSDLEDGRKANTDSSTSASSRPRSATHHAKEPSMYMSPIDTEQKHSRPHSAPGGRRAAPVAPNPVGSPPPPVGRAPSFGPTDTEPSQPAIPQRKKKQGGGAYDPSAYKKAKREQKKSEKVMFNPMTARIEGRQDMNPYMLERSLTHVSFTSKMDLNTRTVSIADSRAPSRTSTFEATSGAESSNPSLGNVD